MQIPSELEIARRLPPSGCSVGEAERYTRWLAMHHYENFNVVSWLLPRRLHQHFYNLYAYCRWADDLGDEISDSAKALVLLDEWDQELRECYAGKPAHPVFIALRKTISALDIPMEPFSDLLIPFRRDQTVHRYDTWNDIFDYCRHSANPVGRLVLYLCGYRDAERQRLSDATCTALQLANFWQDVTRDLEKGRIYIPLDVAAQHGVNESEIVNRQFSDRYVALMKDLIARTRQLFAEGYPLAKMVDGRLSIDLEMFSRSGFAVLDAVEAMGYDTLNHRASVGKGKQARLLARALASHLFSPRKTESKPSVAAEQIFPENLNNPTPQTLMNVSDSYYECHRIARSSKSSFYPAFFLLPKPKRDGIVALYAFMRLIDDVSDESDQLIIKQRGLARWRAALDEAVTGESQVFDGTAARPLPDNDLYGERAVLPALVDTMCRYKMPARYLHDLSSC